MLGESHNYSCKQGIISFWLPNQFPKPTEKKKTSTRPFPTNLEQVQAALNREHGWLISFLTLQSLYTLPTSRASPFYRALPWCTARITLQDISKAQLTRNHPLRFPFLYRQECNITMLPLLPHRCSIPMLTPRSAPLEPQPTTNGDPKVSESSLLCQALPIISLVVVLYAGLQGSRTGP